MEIVLGTCQIDDIKVVSLRRENSRKENPKNLLCGYIIEVRMNKENAQG